MYMFVLYVGIEYDIKKKKNNGKVILLNNFTVYLIFFYIIYYPAMHRVYAYIKRYVILYDYGLEEGLAEH